MKAYRKRSFTLVELLVSIGLLSLMMIFMLRFFSSSQQLWNSGDREAALRQNSHAALDMMSDLLTTVQFTLGEKTVGGVQKRDRTMDSIFSADCEKTCDYGDANEVFFACKTVSALPKKTNDIRFIGFRLGDPASEYARGKLFLLVYADKRDEVKFYTLFPRYDSAQALGNRDKTLKNSLKVWLTPPADESGEDEYAQVIAENVVGFTIEAFNPAATGALVPVTGKDIGEPPYLLRIKLSLLDKEDFATFVTLSGTARTDFLARKARICSREIPIGDRWQLAKARLSE